MEILQQQNDSKIINEINIRLSNIFPHNLNEFKKLIDKRNIYIFGLFIIDCVLEEYLVKKEIDLLVDAKCFELVNNFLETSGFERDGSGGGHYFGGKDTQIIRYELQENLVIHEQNNYKIKIWKTKTTVPINEWINNIMDFDICRNFYSVNDSVEKIYLKSFNQIINKSTKFQFTDVFSGMSYRNSIENYMTMVGLGFNFTNKGNEMYDYLINNAMIITDSNIPKKVYHNFKIKRCGKKKYIDKRGKKKYYYIFDLLEGNMTDLENNLFITCVIHGNKTIVKFEHIIVENGKILIDSKHTKNQCKMEKKRIYFTSYCPLAICDIDKPHFHSYGTNLICDWVRTLLTFFVVG